MKLFAKLKNAVINKIVASRVSKTIDKIDPDALEDLTKHYCDMCSHVFTGLVYNVSKVIKENKPMIVDVAERNGTVVKEVLEMYNKPEVKEFINRIAVLSNTVVNEIMDNMEKYVDDEKFDGLEEQLVEKATAIKKSFTE